LKPMVLNPRGAPVNAGRRKLKTSVKRRPVLRAAKSSHSSSTASSEVPSSSPSVVPDDETQGGSGAEMRDTSEVDNSEVVRPDVAAPSATGVNQGSNSAKRADTAAPQPGSKGLVVPKPKNVKPPRAVAKGVEPQSGANLQRPADKRVVIYRSHSVTPQQKEVIDAKFPQYAFKFGVGAPHDHPLGAMERAVCERIALGLIETRYPGCLITDIGGNADRHAAEGRLSVHSCNPLLSSDDVVRRSHYRKEANYCSSSSMDCKLTPDVYLSVHSLYYLSPVEVLQLVFRSHKQRLFAVVHRFDDYYGTMHDNGDFVESKYETYLEGDKPRIRMQVTGNCTSYTHDPIFWLQSTSYTVGVRTICWNGRPYGDSWIYEFVAAPATYKPVKTDHVGVLSLTSSLNRNDHHGPVSGVLSPGDQGAFKPMLEILKIDTTKIHSFGGIMWLRDTTRSTLIPKGLVDTVALKMVGVSRDKAGLRLCITSMRQLVKSDKMSIPASMRADCVIFGASLAFVVRLQDEITSFNNLCSPFYRRLYHELCSVMSLERTLCQFTMWPPCGTEAFNNTVESYNDDRSSVPGPAFDAALAWPRGLPGIEVNRVLQPVEVGAAVSGEAEAMEEDKPQFFPICQTFSQYIPVVPYASAVNEMTSIRNRALMVCPVPEPGLWKELHAFAAGVIGDWEVVTETDVERGFKTWNSRFPQNKQRNHVIAWEALKVTALNRMDFIRKLFVKRELTMKGGAEPKQFDPRAIQANSDRLNVSLGPFSSFVSDNLKKKWGRNWGEESVQISYTAGWTAEEIGEWRAQFGDRDVTILELDEERYDVHQKRGAYELFRDLMRQQGVDNYGNAAEALRSMEKIQGWSSQDIKYLVEYTMTSGSPTTSVSNSYLNGMKIWFVLLELGVRAFKALVHGDDSLIVILGHLEKRVKRSLEVGVLAYNRRLGFSTKLKISEDWSQVEYCSSLFWPVEGGFVLGPKIGKRLPKIGFSLQVGSSRGQRNAARSSDRSGLYSHPACVR